MIRRLDPIEGSATRRRRTCFGPRVLSATPPIPPTSRPTVGRLAPSPTGGLHLGHARTFLLAWLAARGAAGRILLRIEDLDASRVRPEARSGALDDLRWLCLDWGQGPYVQSVRAETYKVPRERLKRYGMA